MTSHSIAETDLLFPSCLLDRVKEAISAIHVSGGFKRGIVLQNFFFSCSIFLYSYFHYVFSRSLLRSLSSSSAKVPFS
jgi:hypothetical protein